MSRLDNVVCGIRLTMSRVRYRKRRKRNHRNNGAETLREHLHLQKSNKNDVMTNEVSDPV